MLEVIGELAQVLVVRGEDMSLSAVEVVVLDTEDGEDNGEVVLQKSFFEVFVHPDSYSRTRR